jgi:hypothetical protein
MMRSWVSSETALQQFNGEQPGKEVRAEVMTTAFMEG